MTASDTELLPQTRFEAALEDYSDLRSWGLTRAQAAARMGVAARTVERYEATLRGQRRIAGDRS